MAYPNKKCTFANRVVRRSKSQNISALALSLNRYHKSATPPFYSDIQSDTRFLIIRYKSKLMIAEPRLHIKTFHNYVKTGAILKRIAPVKFTYQVSVVSQ